MGSLIYQFKSSIDGNFRPGAEKHSCKKNKSGKVIVFSYSTRESLIKFSCNLVNFLKDNYPEVKKLKEIEMDHIYAFFEEKKKTCSQYTLDQYRSYLHTLEKLIKQHYHFRVKLYPEEKIYKSSKKKKIETKLRNVSMKQEDLDALLKYKANSNSKCMVGLRLADLFGLRVSEICSLKAKDINLEKNYLHIHESKGKRSRNIPIENFMQMSLCNELVEKFLPEERVCPVREDTLNKFLSRGCASLHITRYKNAKTGVHSIRKKVAKQKLASEKKNGSTLQEAKDTTSKYLGHNENRNTVMNAYIKSK
ncbi:tyrosine-type recombinase/integrase [Clostridium sp.]|uniref:site-specific integrase n=1 Tax=Clostridium sp. TaxID=1506 RepID=UPI001B4A32D5|nr:tyrosine-type recombinase/integrase [Clostridium sp.]MBP3916190.1 tyrosine-type recombinase/integrase [Clostridium sp.]